MPSWKNQGTVDAGRIILHPARQLVRYIHSLTLVPVSVLACILLAVTLLPCAAEPATLTTLQAVRTLSKAQARAGVPVAFEATVTYYNKTDVDLFVQEGGEAIYVETKPGQQLVPGDRVLVRGKTRSSFTTDVLGESVTLLSHGLAPPPVPANFEQLIRVQRDCMRVVVRATVRSANTVNFANMHGTYLKLLMEGGSIDATVVETDAARLKNLLDADVEVTGVVSGKFDSKMQLIGILLEVPSFADVKILKRAAVDPDSLPITPMNQVLASSFVHDGTHRVRVKGTITYYQPGFAAVLQNGDESIWISTRSSVPLRIGDVALATGFPDARDGFLTLNDGEIQDTAIYEPVQPQPATWRQLATWNSGDPDGHQNDLVSFEGIVAAAVREGSQDEFVLVADGRLFTAIYRHPPANRPLRPMWNIPVGTRIRVSGICMVVPADVIDPTQQEFPFNILLRSFDDIAVISQPSWLNVRNLIILVGVLVLLLLIAGARGWVTDRRVRRENAKAAYIERRRSRILEEINGTRPLSEVLEQITELVSSKLNGIPCWCQIADGAQLGHRPHELTSFRVIAEPIPARSGAPLGTLYVGFDLLTQQRSYESETLTSAAALATLAIENRRLFSDLVYRSEYDLLTDIHNRFSLERHLDQRIEHARQSAGIFGLVYVDLNDFKQVNDLYGHHVGDLYLQEVSIRMKHQLRAGDTLARLGGDEFAVLLPQVRNRAEIEEIAQRLARSLDEPFAAEGYVVHGSASAGIAVYPEDGTTRESLLRAADATMYVNKHIRRERTGKSGRPHQDPGSASS